MGVTCTRSIGAGASATACLSRCRAPARRRAWPPRRSSIHPGSPPGRTPFRRVPLPRLGVGFAGALRRSELVALDVEDVEEVPEGLRVTIRRSKTDQEGRTPLSPSRVGQSRTRWRHSRPGSELPASLPDRCPAGRQGRATAERAVHRSQPRQDREGSRRPALGSIQRPLPVIHCDLAS